MRSQIQNKIMLSEHVNQLMIEIIYEQNIRRVSAAVFSLFNEIIDGVTTVRAYDVGQRFASTNGMSSTFNNDKHILSG